MSAPFSLVADRFLPVRRRSGACERIRPAQLTERIDDDPIVALDWPRPDFTAATHEFLIGLLATACWREAGDRRPWRTWWRKPPDPATLDAGFAPFAHAFVLDGPGPRFLQDFDALEGEESGVGALLIDAPGAKTLFVKRGRIESLGRAAAAMALFTLQTFAPAGGRGHRTSLRGGGPMSTLVVPDPANPDEALPLWHRLWLNVVWDADWPDPAADPTTVFPWLVPTRVSDHDLSTAPGQVHPAQAYWGMPRRIRLNFTTADDGAPCDLTGAIDTVVVRSYRTRPYGACYQGWSKGHPLSPYYRTKATETEWLPLHPQPGRLGYRDWVGLVIGDAGDATSLRAPAKAVTAAFERLDVPPRIHRARLLAAGFDMDNMKARGFVESEMPVPLAAPEVREAFDAIACNLVAGARDAASLLSTAVGRVRSSGELPAADKGDRLLARDRFWERTEAAFYARITDLPDGLAATADETDQRAAAAKVRTEWLAHLRKTCLALFDELVPLDAIEERDAERLISTRRDLISAFNGFGKAGAGLFTALGLTPPKPPPKPAPGKKKGKKAP